MEDEQSVLVSCYLVERRVHGAPRFFVFGRSVPVDSKAYISLIEEHDELRISFVEDENGMPWVPIDLIVVKILKSRAEHGEFLRRLREGHFDCPMIGLADKRTGFDVLPRPAVIQFDVETLRDNRRPPPESGFSILTKVETFWPEKKQEILEVALDPTTPHLTPDEVILKSSEIEPIQRERLLSLQVERERDRRLQLLIDELSRLTGLSFRDAYSERLCNYESIEMPFGANLSGLQIEVKVEREQTSDGTTIARGVRIRRDQSLADQNLMAHVVLKNNDEVVLDRLIELPLRQPESDAIQAQEVISEYEVRVFNPSGSVIFVERRDLLRTIVGTMLMSTGTKTYRDKLAAKLTSSRRDIGDRLETASPFHPHSMINVGGYHCDPWVVAARSMRDMVRIRTSQPIASRWFPRGLSDQGEVLDYLRQLIDNTENQEVLIADPFFGASAFERLIPRLRNSALRLTVLTSCLGWNPDSDETRGKNAEWEKASAKQREIIAKWCSRNTAIIEINLKIIDIRAGSKQGFHDRYLALVNKQGKVSVHALSNSLNKLAGDYPCCVTKLEAPIAREVYVYLRGLEIGRDLANRENQTGRRLDRTVVWDSIEEGSKRRARNSEERPRLSSGGPCWFPFWRQLLEWLLGYDEEKEDGQLLAHAEEVGLVRRDTNSADWLPLSDEAFSSMIDQAWGRLPDKVSRQAKILAGLGELQARLPDELELSGKITKHIWEEDNKFDANAILSHLKLQYGKFTAPYGFLEDPPSKEVISCANYLYDSELTFRFLTAAENYFDYHFETRVRGLYGLRWTIQLFLMTNPGETVTWAGQDHRDRPHVCAAIIAAVVDGVMDRKTEWFVNSLLRSQNAFLKLMGVSALSFTEYREEEFADPPERTKVTPALLAAGISGGDALWMSALPVPKAQAAVYRTRELPSIDPKRLKAEQFLEHHLEGLAHVLVDTRPNEQQLNQLDQALRNSTRDRFQIAIQALKIAPGTDHKPWERLYERCVTDVETLVGRRPDGSFTFFADSHFDMLDVGAQSFVKLHCGNVAKRLRNRFQGHLEALVRIASDPLAPASDHNAWNDSVGRAAAGCLFGLSVCQHASNSGHRNYIPEMVAKLIAITCQLQIGSARGWLDLAGLLDRLAQETAWAVASLSDPVGIETADQASNDDRLLLYYRACMACVPYDVFKRDPDRAYALLASHVDSEEPRRVARYFYLLDFVIGNSYRNSQKPERLIRAVEAGLASYSDIPTIWKDYFKSAWDALNGDTEKKEKILSESATAQSYCGMLLTESEIYA
jgi:hypothetical protein